MLGNPFFMANESMRDEVCDKYAEFFKKFCNDPDSGGGYDYLQQLILAAKTQDIVLMCWCHPKRCHAHIIAEFINKAI